MDMYDCISAIYFKNNFIFKKYIDDNIPDNILATDFPDVIDDPKEYESHITILYGIKSNKYLDAVKKIYSETLPVEIVLKEITLFDNNNDFDVIKIDIDSPALSKLNEEIRSKVPYQNKYNDYKPHLTLAYVKKGMGDNFIGDRTFFGKKFLFKKGVFGEAGTKKQWINFKKVSDVPDKEETPEEKPESKIPEPEQPITPQNPKNPVPEETIKEYLAYNLGGGGYGSAAGGATAPLGQASTPDPQVSYTRTSFPPVNVISYDYNTVDDKDTDVPGIDKDELLQGIKYEMERMEIPEKTKAKSRAINKIKQDPHYYSGLDRYLTDNKNMNPTVDLAEIKRIVTNDLKKYRIYLNEGLQIKNEVKVNESIIKLLKALVNCDAIGAFHNGDSNTDIVSDAWYSTVSEKILHLLEQELSSL